MGKQVKDQSSMHRYRTEIPNIIDDMDLSVYAFRLYVRLKRVAGDDGKCFFTTRQLAEQCRMSVGAVSKAKQELAGKDLIRVDSDGKWVRDNITIVDMWPANFAYFAQEKEETPCSHSEQPVHHTNIPVHHTNVKEEPIKEEPKKESKPLRVRASGDVHPNTKPIMDAYLEALGYTPGNYGQESSAAKQLAKQGYLPVDVTAAYELLKQQPFWQTKHLSLQTLVKEIPALKQAHLNGVARPPTPRFSTNNGTSAVADYIQERQLFSERNR